MPSPSATPLVRRSPPAPASTPALLGLGLCLFAACIAGIWSRPTGFLSSFWPANALMLGLLLRLPRLGHWKTWPMALAVFVLADLFTGSSLLTALWLSAANLCGVACGWWFLRRLDPPRLRLQRQTSALYLLAGCTLAAAGSTLVGAGTGPQLFNSSWSPTALMWFSTELMNFVLIVPLVLSAPGRGESWWPATVPSLTALLPLLSVLAAEYAAITLGGPGALAFIVPALLWCALSYSLFTTTLLSMMVCTWKMASMSLSMGAFAFTPLHFEAAVSLRLGLTLLSLGPLAVASAQAARNELLRRLDHAVSHDFLTNTLARGAFLARSQRLLERLHRQPSAVLMLDLDHFKQVNDHHGHPAGDALLRALTQTVGQVLRPQDLLGRMGGEEFAVLLPGVQAATAQQIATRICTAVRAQRLTLPEGSVLQATVSIGLVLTDGTPQTLDELLHAADAALYQAKAAGRDRWQCGKPRDHAAKLVVDSLT